jgi:hypothetical protein
MTVEIALVFWAGVPNVVAHRQRWIGLEHDAAADRW